MGIVFSSTSPPEITLMVEIVWAGRRRAVVFTTSSIFMIQAQMIAALTMPARVIINALTPREGRSMKNW
jgi:hypothetical protein